MKLGQVTRIEIDDVTLMVKLTWGDLKRLLQQSHDLPEGDEQETGIEQLDWVQGVVKDHVVSISGLQDAGGKEITKLDDSNIEELPPRFVMDIWKRMAEIGAEGSDTVVPPS